MKINTLINEVAVNWCMETSKKIIPGGTPMQKGQGYSLYLLGGGGGKNAVLESLRMSNLKRSTAENHHRRLVYLLGVKYHFQPRPQNGSLVPLRILFNNSFRRKSPPFCKGVHSGDSCMTESAFKQIKKGKSNTAEIKLSKIQQASKWTNKKIKRHSKNKKL